jgi:hypothetical protein
VIDFRYHLVSIISIFLALAVGIVLGAGPLQSNLGSTLGDQVIALRTEKQTLNDKLTQANKLVAAGDDYAAGVTPRLVSGRVTGHGVVLVVLPAAESNLVDSVTSVLNESGAELRGTVTLQPSWFDPAAAAARSKVAAQVASDLGLPTAPGDDALLREALAKLVVSDLPIEPNPERVSALAALTDAGLLETSVPELVTGDLAVIVSGDYSGTQEVVDERSAGLRDLAKRLLTGSRTTIVVGGAPVQAAGQPVTSDAVSAIRSGKDTSTLISTVDHARDGLGPSTVVLALEAQLAHQVGHYGVAADATAVVPEVAP